jgi:MFS transporter, FHS family, L-fucose permease
MKRIETFFVSKVGVSFFNVFVLLLALFFLWGFALGLLDILNNHFQTIIQTDGSKYAFVLLTYYIGYLLMPIPTSIFTERFGYRKGIILGLVLYALGSFMFLPTSHYHSFPLFLLSLFCIALGMAALETVVNPYATLVGKNKYSTFRITLGHSFTSLGWFFGPFVGRSILLDIHEQNTNEFSSIAVPYVGVGVLVLFLAILLSISISDLPKFSRERAGRFVSQSSRKNQRRSSIFKRRHFTWGVVTMFFYMVAQTAVFGFYTRYLFDLFKSLESKTVFGHDYLLKVIQVLGGSDVVNDKLYHSVAALIFTFAGFGLFTLGRFFGSFLLIKIRPNKLLILTSGFSLLFSIIMGLNLGIISFFALCLITLSMSTMFPIIFSLGIRKMGNKTKRASAYIIMAIAGGSTYPIITNAFPSVSSVDIGLVFLLMSFIFTFTYGYRGYKIDDETRANLVVNN